MIVTESFLFIKLIQQVCLSTFSLIIVSIDHVDPCAVLIYRSLNCPVGMAKNCLNRYRGQRFAVEQDSIDAYLPQIVKAVRPVCPIVPCISSCHGILQRSSKEPEAHHLMEHRYQPHGLLSAWVAIGAPYEASIDSIQTVPELVVCLVQIHEVAIWGTIHGNCCLTCHKIASLESYDTQATRQSCKQDKYSQALDGNESQGSAQA
jgi:hypothetical protein